MKKRVFCFLLSAMMLFTGFLPVYASDDHSAPVLDDSLVIRMTFDEDRIEDNGVIRDSSGNENNGTIVSGSVGTMSLEPGISGNALYIDNDTAGANDSRQAAQYINLGKPVDLGAGSFSFSFWMKSMNGSISECAILSNKDYRSNSRSGLYVGGQNENFRVNIGDGSSGSNLHTTKPLDQKWHHIFANYNITEKYTQLFIDGVEIEKKSFSNLNEANLGTAYDLFLGASGTQCSGLLNSYIDELSVYSRNLSAMEVTALYEEAGYIDVEGYLADIEAIMMKVESLTPNADITAKAIEAFTETAERVKEEVSAAGEDGEALKAIYESFSQEFDQFMIGSEPLLGIFAISDIHILTSDLKRSEIFEQSLQDMGNIDPDAAFLNAGDFAEWGKTEEYQEYYRILDEFAVFPDQNIFTAMGNHDVRGTSWDGSNPQKDLPSWDAAAPLYNELNGRYMNPYAGEENKLFHDEWVNGYHFIVLNTEAGWKDWMDISDQQLEWLEETLSEDASSGKPIFVMGHNPVAETGVRSTYYKLGNDRNGASTDEKVKAIFKKYPQVVYFSGHSHNSFGYAELIDREFGLMVDLPSLTKPEYTAAVQGETKGTGYYLKVYEDCLVFKPRNFYTGQWLNDEEHFGDVVIHIETMPEMSKMLKELKQEDEEDNRYSEESVAEINRVLELGDTYFAKEYENIGDRVPALVDLHFKRRDRETINEIRDEMTTAYSNAEYKPADQVVLDKPEAVMKIGESVQLNAALSPEKSKPGIVWESSDPQVAAVDEHGNVNARKSGTAEITAKALHGAAQSACTIKVEANKPITVFVKSITLTSRSSMIKAGEKTSISATVLPTNATDKSISYRSSDPKVATVSASGEVTGIKAGKVTITAAARDGSGVIGNCAITVREKDPVKVPVEKVVFKNDKTVTIAIGKKVSNRKATVTPNNATIKAVIYTSDNPKAAKVDKTTGVVTAVAAGSAKITAKCDGKSDTYTVKVKPATVKLKAVKSTRPGKAVVSWKKVKGASGYEVLVSTKRTSWKKVRKFKVKASKSKYTVSKLKGGKKVYVKVRAYKGSGKSRIYGNYSKVRSKKVKK